MFAAVCTVYYLVRETYDPGYWTIVWWSEFTRIGEDIQPWLHFPLSFYFERFYDPLFQEYILLLAALFPPFILLKQAAHKRLVLALLSGALIYLGFISLPPGKLEWYDAPVYPLLCAATGLMIREFTMTGLKGRSAWHLAAVAILWIVTGITVKNSFIHVAGELSDEPHSGYTHQTIPDGLKIFHDRHRRVQSFNVLIPPTPPRFAHHLDELTFYKTIYEHYEGKRINISDTIASLQTGDTLICNREALDQIEKGYSIVRLDSTAGGAMWVLLGSTRERLQLTSKSGPTH